MANIEEIAKKILEDDEYRDFLINGITQKHKTKGYFVYRKSRDGSIVKKGETIADDFYEDYEGYGENRYKFYSHYLKASVEGFIVYNYTKDEDAVEKGYLKAPHFATIYHKDKKFYLSHIDEIIDFSLKNFNCAFLNESFVGSLNSESSFELIKPTFKSNIDEIFLTVEKITNILPQHTGNLKISLRFSRDEKDFKVFESELNKALEPRAAISDIFEKGTIKNDPDSGVYEVSIEVYELIVDGSWKLQTSKKIMDNFEWKSRKQYVAEKIIENPLYIENGTDAEVKFYYENKEAIENLKNVILQKINDINIQKVNESATKREEENTKEETLNRIKGLVDSLGNYIDSFDIALESGKLNDMDILRQLRTIDETLSSLVELRDQIDDKSKILRNKNYIQDLYNRYKQSDVTNKSVCLRMETLISLFDEL